MGPRSGGGCAEFGYTSTIKKAPPLEGVTGRLMKNPNIELGGIMAQLTPRVKEVLDRINRVDQARYKLMLKRGKLVRELIALEAEERKEGAKHGAKESE